MRKIYLASFLQPENFGPGRIIGICRGEKPRELKVDTIFEPLIPETWLVKQYNRTLGQDKELASKQFVIGYFEQLELFIGDVKDVARDSSCLPEEILPFEDGVTLCSWERKEFTNYRKISASALELLGYNVVCN